MRNYPMADTLFSGCSLLLLCTFSFAMSPADTPRRVQHLDEMTALVSHTQGWGVLGVNTAAHASGAEPMGLRIADREYDRGVGHHAPGEITVPVNGSYLSFMAEVGVQWQGGDRGSVVFEVWVDGEKRFDSDVMTDSDPAIPVEIDLRNAHELRLVAKDGGDGISCDMANWSAARFIRDACIPDIGAPLFFINSAPLEEPVEMEGNYALIGNDAGSQFAFNRYLGFCAAVVAAGDTSTISIPLRNIACPFEVQLDYYEALGRRGHIALALESGVYTSAAVETGYETLTLSHDAPVDADVIHISVTADESATMIRLLAVRMATGAGVVELNVMPPQTDPAVLRVPRAITHHPALEFEMVEWDWRMQDGIGAGETRNTYSSAVEIALQRGEALLAALPETDAASRGRLEVLWADMNARFRELRMRDIPEDALAWEELWRAVHVARRAMLFAHPLADTGRLLFVKQAPGVFSHQLTQYYGRYARPGGGLFELERPLGAMNARELSAGQLPQGSYMQPEVSYDGARVLFAFCRTDAAPEDMFNGHWGRHYNIYEVTLPDATVRQLTDGDYDDFSPVELPNGQIMLISTRRGGWHRCGGIGCPVYTLTLMEADGDNIRTVSYHETQEWDPAVLNDGRIIYTRWDYIDRHAIHYQQLWTAHPDGTGPVAFYGNHTLNPVGVWESRAVPGSHKIMATAAAHHAMTAGSLILIDPTVGIDDHAPITRLTPHAPFPESEEVLRPGWRSAAPTEPPERTPEMERWPQQCYRSPWPLSETLFLAAYSFDPLMGEPNPNLANMFGLYLVDAYGNKELLYRDLNISSLWPMPLRPREPAPSLPSSLPEDGPGTGTYYLQDVYQSLQPWPPDTRITQLRITQVLPKSTPVAHNPPMGLAFASPGKQVLGVVPVEADGSAYFSAPAGLPLSFQALDDTGQAVQTMRSVTYLQPGENASCVGCHEPRLGTPSAPAGKAAALGRIPSAITPGPDGSRPFSYPILVQPVLDKHCVRCHSGDDAKSPEGQEPIRLTGRIEGQFTESYNALAPRVAYAAWGKGDSLADNSEPITQPGFFGAIGSSLMEHLRAGHQDVSLDDEDMERLITWMDTNGLFYGTFNFDDQERQQRGERIAGPDIE